MKPTKKDFNEAKGIVKQIEKIKSSLPDKDKNILEWTPGELRAYIATMTKGMKATKKMKFAANILDKIKKEKKKRDKNKKAK